MHEDELKCYKAVRKPHINKNNIKKHSVFAKKICKYATLSKFELRQLKKKHNVWRKRNEGYKRIFYYANG